MKTERSDEMLFELWAGGDRGAGKTLFERHFDSVHRFLRTKVGSGLEDLVQQVFLGCIEGRDRYQAKSTFRAYLFGIVRFQLFNHYRATRKDARLDFSVGSLASLGTTPSAGLARNAEEFLLHEALGQLPLDQQIVLELLYWENLSGGEVADVLEVSLDTVYGRARRAKSRLGDLLQELRAERSLTVANESSVRRGCACRVRPDLDKEAPVAGE